MPDFQTIDGPTNSPGVPPQSDPFKALGAVPVTAPENSTATGNDPIAAFRAASTAALAMPRPDPIAAFRAAAMNSAQPNDPFVALGAKPVVDTDQPPAPPDTTGTRANIRAGVQEGAAGIINTLSDPVGNLIFRPLTTAGAFIYDALAPHLGYNRLPPDLRADLTQDDPKAPQPGTAAVDTLSDAMGKPRASDVPPSPVLGDRLLRAGIGGGLQMAALAPVAGINAVRAGIAGFTGAATGQAVSEVVPDWAKPFAGLVGNVVGAGVPAAVEQGVRAVGTSIADRTVGPTAGAPQPIVDASGAPIPLSTITGNPDHTQPIMATPQQAALAGQKLATAASDPKAAAVALSQNAPPLVTGSAPTTFQATGDQGLGNFERVAATNNPDIAIGRQNQQNAARGAAIRSAGEPDADPAAVPAAIQAKRDAMVAQYGQAAAGAQGRVAAAVEGLGGATPAGGDATAMQTYGARMRGEAPILATDDTAGSSGTSLVGARSAAKARENALWTAIDPDKSLIADMTPVRSAALTITGAIPKNAAPLDGPEATIFKTAAGLPDTQPFEELTALRSRVTDALSQEQRAGNGQTVRRLSQLLDGIHVALASSVADKAASDSSAVASGQMAPEQSMMARLGTKLSPAKPAPIPGSEGGGGGGLAPPTDGRAEQVAGFGESGTGVSAGRGPGSAASDSLVAPGAADAVAASPAPNFDAMAAARYAAARAQTRALKSTFDEAPGVGVALAPGKFAGEFATPDSAVPGNIFTSKDRAAERVQAYIKAGGDIPALNDYVSFSLRKTAQAADGTLDPAKYATWKAAHQEALSALEQASPGLTNKYNSVAEASAAVRDATARAAANVKAFEGSVAKAFLGGADPVAEVGKVLSSPRSIVDMRELRKQVGSDPAALAGLRQAVVDHVLKAKVGNAAAGETGTNVIKSDAFQTFIKNAEPAMRVVMTPEQVDTLKAVASDLQRANKSIAGTKLPGGSNTPQDIAAGAKLGAHTPKFSSTLGMMAMEGAGFAAEAAHAHIIPALATTAAVTWAGLKLKAMRDAGVQHVQDLAELAAFSPPLAHVLLEKAAGTAAENAMQLRKFRVQLNRAMLLAASRYGNQTSGK